MVVVIAGPVKEIFEGVGCKFSVVGRSLGKGFGGGIGRGLSII